MTAELFEYVKITQNNDGYATVEVCNKDRKTAVKIYLDTIEELENSDTAVPIPQEFETKASNENTKFMPVLTVKGKGPEVVTTYIEELARMNKNNGGESNGK